jgi:hypothetical protein
MEVFFFADSPDRSERIEPSAAGVLGEPRDGSASVTNP